jgi:hypothetical protein
MLSKAAIGLAIVAVGASVYIKYYGFPDLQQEPANVQAQLDYAASMKTGEPMVLILGTHEHHVADLTHICMFQASSGIYRLSSLLLCYWCCRLPAVHHHSRRFCL